MNSSSLSEKGSHAPQEAARMLGEAIDYARLRTDCCGHGEVTLNPKDLTCGVMELWSNGSVDYFGEFAFLLFSVVTANANVRSAATIPRRLVTARGWCLVVVTAGERYGIAE